MNLVLQRLTPNAVATQGLLSGLPRQLFSIELPWHNNDANRSCVPAGVFDLVPYLSPKHGRTYCLRNAELKILGAGILTPAQVAAGYRSLCELHSANWAAELRGCIAFGFESHPMLDPLTGRVEPAVEHSGDAIEYLLEQLEWATAAHTLTIEDLAPPSAPA
ncbi:MAG TPA: DUF5675 family protein [Steroidobacteraceae bacterium]